MEKRNGWEQDEWGGWGGRNLNFFLKMDRKKKIIITRKRI